MNKIIRNAFVVASGLALAWFSFAASAAGPTKQFSINVTQGAIVGPGTSEFVLEIRNETPNGNSTINSMDVTLPGSFTIVRDGTHAAAFTTPSSGQVSAPNGATSIAISNLYPLKPQQVLMLKFWANSGATAGCTSGYWNAHAWTGSSFSGDTFAQLTPAQVSSLTNGARTIVSSTTIVSDAALQFGSITSVVAGTAFSVTVNQTSSCGTSVTLPPVSVTLEGTPDFTGGGTKTTSGGSATFTGNKFGTAGTATLTASASGFASATLTLPVYDGTLACVTTTNFDALNLPATGTGSFDASEDGAAAVGDTGFVAGVRGTGDPGKDDCSKEINYALYNNIPTSYNSNITDPAGNVVYPGFYSFSWDTNIAPNPVVAVVATFRPEWGDAATGLPKHKTLICGNASTPQPCTTAPYDGSGNVQAPWKPAVACLSTIVTHSSVPAGEIGCVASERWDVVPALIPDPLDTNDPPALIANPDFCAGSPPSGAVPSGGRCLKPTSIMIMGQDPVFGR